MTVAAGWSLAVTLIKILLWRYLRTMNPFSSPKLFEQTDQKKVILNTQNSPLDTAYVFFCTRPTSCQKPSNLFICQQTANLLSADFSRQNQKNEQISRQTTNKFDLWGHSNNKHCFAGIQHFSIRNNYPRVYTPFCPVDMHTLSNHWCHTPLFLMFFTLSRNSLYSLPLGAYHSRIYFIIFQLVFL